MEFEFVDSPTIEQEEYLWQNLRNFNTSKLQPQKLPDSKHFCIFIKEENEVLGGAICSIYNNGLNLQCLWIDEKLRLQGLGKKLLFEIESLAKKYLCTVIFLHTFDFQAPKFYIKQGYEIFGKIENFPVDYDCFFLRKYLGNRFS